MSEQAGRQLPSGCIYIVALVFLAAGIVGIVGGINARQEYMGAPQVIAHIKGQPEPRLKKVTSNFSCWEYAVSYELNGAQREGTLCQSNSSLAQRATVTVAVFKDGRLIEATAKPFGFLISGILLTLLGIFCAVAARSEQIVERKEKREFRRWAENEARKRHDELR